MKAEQVQTCLFCNSTRLSQVFQYDKPPTGEMIYAFSREGAEYKRSVVSCDTCQHFYSVHQFDLKALYEGDYVGTTYGERGIDAAFNRIIALDPARSDNVGRVHRIERFRTVHFASVSSPSCLDVGSGLCVFLHRLKSFGWTCHALDPDKRAVEHARERVGIQAECADFYHYTPREQFTLLSFNKVLEHVEYPEEMLRRAAPMVRAGGAIYIEVPDGEMAALEGQGREEFFVEHHHAFSAASLALLIGKSGLRLLELERLQEPSSKYTLRAFAAPYES